MDPVSLILAVALQNPDSVAGAANAYSAPGQVDTARLTESLADFAIQTLKCYHKTAHFRNVEVIGTQWPEQSKFGAEKTVLLRIDFTGVTGSKYQMAVAAMTKGASFRTFVVRENSLIQYNKNCSLEYWNTTLTSQPKS